MIDNLQEFTEGLPPLLQWLGVMAAAAIPFVESYFGAVIGVLAGLNPVVAIIAAVVGNVISMVLVVLSADRLRARRGVTPVEQLSPRKQRLRRMLDRFGVPGVSLLGQTVLPSQITSGALVAFGASTRGVIGWQVVSIILWGVAFGTLAVLGVDLVQNS
nr:small multi-drug export protein [Serinicoccus profundi]